MSACTAHVDQMAHMPSWLNPDSYPQNNYLLFDSTEWNQSVSFTSKDVMTAQ